MRFTSRGDLLVTAPQQGKVFLLEPDADGDGSADHVRFLLTDLKRPHGIDVHDGFVYVGEGNAVLRAPFDASTGKVTGAAERIAQLPEEGSHWTRTVAVGPDEHLYVAMGSTCNVCVKKDPRRAAISRYNLDGTGEELYATGLRNSVGFAWRPGTNDLYATDNG